MPAESIIDSHVHLWDPRRMRYPWLKDIPLLNRPYLPEDFWATAAAVPIESFVFIQCEAEPTCAFAEAEWIAQLASRDSHIKAMVAWAALEKGSAVREDLEQLKRHSILRGVRRIIQFEPDPEFCLQPRFIEGVRALKDFDLSFDLCIDHRHLANVLKLAEQAPNVPMVLDHIGKPAIRQGRMHPWAQQLRELARFPNVWCKISGVATEADHTQWNADELRAYIEVAIEAFGFHRVMFGSDWPVVTQALTYGRWVDLLDEILAGVGEPMKRHFWYDNAARFYRL